MTLGLLLSLAVCAFVLGVALHVALYAPTAALPPMWRNLTRYFLGVAAVLAAAGAPVFRDVLRSEPPAGIAGADIQNNGRKWTAWNR